MIEHFDIVCIGNICVDIRMIASFYPEENSKTRMNEEDDYDISCGGPSATSSAVGALHGLNSAFIGTVAEDDLGHMVIRHLNQCGVNTNLVKREKNKTVKTALAAVTVTKITGKRTILSKHSSKLVIKKEELQEFSASVLEFDGQELEASMRAMKMNPAAITILDAGTVKEATKQLAKKVDYVICSKDFAEDMVMEATGRSKKNNPFVIKEPKDVIYAFQIMEKIFPGNIVITLEEKGCAYKTYGDVRLVPTLNLSKLGLEVKDTTGAGDIFHGLFAEAMVKRMDIETALRYSNIGASLSVTEIGGISSIPSLEKIAEAWKSYDEESILLNPDKPFSLKK